MREEGEFTTNLPGGEHESTPAEAEVDFAEPTEQDPPLTPERREAAAPARPGPATPGASWRQFVAVALVFLMIGGLLGAAAMKQFGMSVSVPEPQSGARQGELPGVLPVGQSGLSVPEGTTDEQQTIRVVADTIRSVVQVQIYQEVVRSGSSEPRLVPIGSGSGFVYSSEGYIVTNNHVVDQGDAFRVEFPSGEQLDATVVGTDKLTDLAVIKVDQLPEGAEPLPLADSSQIKVGQTAVAIGNPMTQGADQFGLGRTPTVTRGIVSAVDRSMPVMSDEQPNVVAFRIENLIQTDAAINKGNSGGPLLNTRAQVVGVNTAIIPSTQGIGFAVPSSIVARVAPMLIENGKVTRPYLGITYRDLRLVLQEDPTLDTPVQQGALVMEASPGGPAAEAGLRGTAFTQQGALAHLGDIIVAINDVSVNGDTLAGEILRYEPGDRVKLTFYRGDELQETVVELGSR